MRCGLCRLHTARGHLHNRVKGHKQQSSAIAKHYKNMHGTMPQDLLKRFQVLKKCKNKFDCLVNEMLFIRALKPNLNVQSDSIRAKVFFIILASSYVNFSCQHRFKCRNLHDLFYIYLDNGVMTTPKRRFYSLMF